MTGAWLALAVLLCLPLAARAEALLEGANWRTCETDADCVLIKGVCHDTAVNVAYKVPAMAFYKQQANGADCPHRFWEVKQKIAQCRPKAGDEQHRSSSCDAVVETLKTK